VFVQLDLPMRRKHTRRVPKSYLTVREVMDRTGWTRQWVNSLIKREKLKAIQKKNGRWLIEEKSFLNYDPEADRGGPRKKA
jgi:hypothetical protein